MRVIGLMSGTSFDGIDAAAADLDLDGDRIVLRPLGGLAVRYPDELRVRIAAVLPPSITTVEDVCRLDTGIGQAFAEAAATANEKLCAGRAELVVAHGQTVFHWAEGTAVRGTLQIGQPAWIAERTGCAVVADLRSRDVAAGGQGAPLVSAVDVMWLRGRPGAPVALNLGGIANVTVVPPGADAIAFDTGPANALLDLAVSERTAGRLTCDVDGAMAARGRVDAELLDRLLAEPYYARRAPKTTGKELFHRKYLDAALAGLPAVADDDLAATLTALTARTVADAVRSVGGTEVIAAGGGTRNPTLMRALAAELPGVPVRSSDELGLPAAWKEAYAFALLGFCTVHDIPATVASCTGARHPSVLGAVLPGRAGFPWRPRPERLPRVLEIVEAAA
ncbi:anhydro-N-acetylmuramic acid kinase [Pseudonocardia alaniniphila]|uniref:Anhydro-N-acetylmuramic acid kinase n=1 Tax=Pseudonocardia alaniniphila TaxID=75291 RepID=A0ABS9TBK2_9PSEU|nr:anhydro-N-acetylmuramic acid kinase [Pseudonocardia alaniniphila]MCH6165887.1 anhydro-N-acetylmuramic acid kinase [Pseudonocardia alaniniphila]